MGNVINIESRDRCGVCKCIFKKTALVGHDKLCPECYHKKELEVVERMKRLYNPRGSFDPPPVRA